MPCHVITSVLVRLPVVALDLALCQGSVPLDLVVARGVQPLVLQWSHAHFVFVLWNASSALRVYT